jgi:Fur family ferric uptake transcriptional regulator
MTKKARKPHEQHFRNTRIREEMITLFVGNQGVAFSEAEINQLFGNRADRVSIYRNIRLLLQKSVIHRIVCEGGKLRYAMEKRDLPQQQHPHFECTACGRVSCLTGSRPARLALPEGFVAHQMEMLIKGICPKCTPH